MMTGLYLGSADSDTTRDTTPSLVEIFKGFTDAIPLLGLVLTADGEFRQIIANPQTEDFLYDDPEALLGESLFDVFPAELAEEFATVIEQALRTGTGQSHEYQLPTQSGQRYFRGHVAPLPNATDDKPHVIWIAEDITEPKLYEDQLRRFRQAVDAAEHAVFITDDDGHIQYVNPAFERITGYSVQEAVQATPRILKSGEMPEGYFEEQWKTLLAGETWEEEIVNQRKDGELYHAYQTIAPIQDDAGDIEGFVAIQRDITDRIELKEDHQRQREHLNRTEKLANVGGWEYVPATETLRLTDGTRRIFGVADDYQPTIGEVMDFFHPEDRPVIQGAFEECLDAGVSFSVTVRIITEAGRQRWVHTKGERVYEEGAPKLSGVIQDISNQKLNEQRLMVLNRVLRHDLRNKLTAVMGYAGLLESQVPEGADDLYGKIERSAESLLSLAETSRQFNRALELDYTVEPVDVESLLAELCEDYRATFPKATIESDVPAVAVPGNKAAVRMLFDELLENALKHNHRPEPTVTVTVTRPSDDRVAMRIADDGPGLPETEQKVIEAGEETALIHSDGMGLWVVNLLTTKLSGGVHVSADEDSGTEITVTLPTTALQHAE